MTEQNESYLEYEYIRGCQFPVPDPTAYEDGFMSDCGEPAIAKAWWDNKEQYLFVCNEHLTKLIEIDNSIEEK